MLNWFLPHRRLMRCINCNSENTTFIFPYHFKRYRKFRRIVKMRCRECGKKWHVVYS